MLLQKLKIWFKVLTWQEPNDAIVNVFKGTNYMHKCTIHV